MAKKSTQAQAFFLELDQVIAAFQDIDSDWEESFGRYRTLAESLDNKRLLGKASVQPGFHSRMDELELAMALHPAADPVKVENFSLIPQVLVKNEGQIVVANKYFRYANYITTIRGLANNPCLPIWHDVGNESFLKVARESIAHRLVQVFDLAAILHQNRNPNIPWVGSNVREVMRLELTNFIAKIEGDDQNPSHEVHYTNVRIWVREAEGRGQIIAFAALTDRLYQIVQIPKRYRFEHLYRHLLPEQGEE